MKKFLALLLAALMVLSIVACTAKPDTNNGGNEVSEETPDAKSLVSKAFIDPVKDWAQYDAHP